MKAVKLKSLATPAESVSGARFAAGWAIIVLPNPAKARILPEMTSTLDISRSERIGPHRLAVIFALMAFGQTFCFFGMLGTLPASAAQRVGLRGLYLGSHCYRGL